MNQRPLTLINSASDQALRPEPAEYGDSISMNISPTHSGEATGRSVSIGDFRQRRPEDISASYPHDYQPEQHLTTAHAPESEPSTVLPSSLTSTSTWVVLDFIVTLCSAAISSVARSKQLTLSLLPPLQGVNGWNPHLLSCLAAILFAFCVASLTRLFRLQPFRHGQNVRSECLLIAVVVSLSVLVVNGALTLPMFPVTIPETLQFVLTCFALSLSRILWRWRREVHFENDVARKNYLVVGTDWMARDIKEYLTSLHYLGYRFKGFVTLATETTIHPFDGGSSVVGNIGNVISLAKSMFVDEIIFSCRPAVPGILADILSQAETAGIDIRLIPSVSEAARRQTGIEYLGNLPTVVLHRRAEHAVENLVKRAMDIILGSIALMTAFPLFVIVALLIKVDSRGPILYKSKRVGYKGTTFTCYKFRSMVEDAELTRDKLAHLNERHDILFKIAKDPRVTRVGAFLRKYSLDEFPQLWNVLKGDMSLVGPRPSIRSEVSRYQTDHLQRLDVVPGMTGLWQVTGRRDPSFENYVNLDRQYIRDWSIWLDLKILARTLDAVVRGTGT